MRFPWCASLQATSYTFIINCLPCQFTFALVSLLWSGGGLGAQVFAVLRCDTMCSAPIFPVTHSHLLSMKGCFSYSWLVCFWPPQSTESRLPVLRPPTSTWNCPMPLHIRQVDCFHTGSLSCSSSSSTKYLTQPYVFPLNSCHGAGPCQARSPKLTQTFVYNATAIYNKTKHQKN